MLYNGNRAVNKNVTKKVNNMRSLNSICQARDEARYISRTWNNTPSAPDVSYPIPYTKPVKSPDDIIGVCTINFMTLSGLGIVYIKRSEYEAEKEKFVAIMDFWNKAHERKSK